MADRREAFNPAELLLADLSACMINSSELSGVLRRKTAP